MSKEIKKIIPILIILLFFYSIFIFRTRFIINGVTYFTLVDDAMISMRYARNLSLGHGLVWNVGETPVQGFTNTGWVFLMSFIHLLNFPENLISLFVMIISLIIIIASLLIFHSICSEIIPKNEFTNLFSVLLIGFYFPLVYWTLRGMEVGAISLLVSLAIFIQLKTNLSIIKKNLLISIIFFLLLLIRIDTIVFISALLFFQFFYSHEKKNVFIQASVVIISLISIIIFQYIYFGYPFPNTYYLKLGNVTTFERFISGINNLFLYSIEDFWVPLIIVLLFIFKNKFSFPKYFILFILLFISGVIYSLYTGGDYAEIHVGGTNRYILVGMPYLFILCSYSLERLIRNSKLSFSKNIIVGLLFLTIFLSSSGNEWINWIVNNAPMLSWDIEQAKIGLSIRENTPENTIIATHTAGQIPYYSNRYTIDLLGKNDLVIAHGSPSGSFRPGHNKWNYSYSILELKPDIIADEWGDIDEFILLNANDYKKLKNGIWITKSKEELFSFY